MNTKEMKVADVLKTAVFAQKITEEMEWREQLQTRAIAKFGRLKRTTLDRLRERGVWNAQMADLYAQVIDGTLQGYSRAEREYIRELGNSAYRKAFTSLQEKEGNV